MKISLLLFAFMLTAITSIAMMPILKAQTVSAVKVPTQVIADGRAKRNERRKMERQGFFKK